MKFTSLLLLVLILGVLGLQGCDKTTPYPPIVDIRDEFVGKYLSEADSTIIDSANGALRIYSSSIEKPLPFFKGSKATSYKDSVFRIEKYGTNDIKITLTLPNGKKESVIGTNLVLKNDTVRFLVQSLTLPGKDSLGKIDTLDRTDVLIQGNTSKGYENILLNTISFNGGYIEILTNNTRLFLSTTGFHRKYLGKVPGVAAKYDSVYQTPFTRVLRGKTEL